MSDRMQELEEQQNVPVSPQFPMSSSVGQRLRFFREQREWTVQFVAEQLKLSQSQIIALEADQFEKLPKLVIVRGFVRAYAKLLRIDASELMSLMPQDTETVALEASLRPALATPFIEPRMTLTGHTENNKRYVVGIIVLVIVAALIVLAQRTDFGQQLVSKLFGRANEVTETVPVPLAAPDLSQIQTASGATVNDASASAAELNATSLPTPDLVASSTASSEASKPVASVVDVNASKASVEPEKEAASSVSVANDAKPMADKLVLRFKNDSWLFVKATNGAVLISRMVRAGAEESFEVKQGLYVKIGNATDVEATLRGKPLPVTTERDSKVASLSVK